jgi:hypothetical protein
VRKILLALVFAAAFFQQTVFAPDALERTMTDGQIEFTNQAAGTKRGKCFAELHELRFGCRRSFLRLVMASTWKCEQAGRPVLLETVQPLPDGGHDGDEKPRGGFNAALFGALDQPQTMVIGVFQSHAPEPPWRGDSNRCEPTTSFRSNTSTSLRGYDVSRLSQQLHFLDDLRGGRLHLLVWKRLRVRPVEGCLRKRMTMCA